MKRALLNTALCAFGAAACLTFVPIQPADAERAIGLFSLYGATGDYPVGGVIADSHGNLFGTTTSGGSGPCDAYAGCGTVYELSPPASRGANWTLNVLYNFQGGQDGSFATAQLTLGPKGSVYGYAAGTGTYGTVFQLIPPAGGSGAWTFQILYIFTGQQDGNLDFVYSPLIRHNGELYGIASGGTNACGNQYLGCGSVFKLSQSKSGSWREKTLFAFSGGAGSGSPTSIVGPDSNGAFYVSTSDGDGADGNGAVVQLANAGGGWNENVLTKFNGGGDGSLPASLVMMPGGAIYGIASATKGGLAFQLANNGSGWTRTNIVDIAHGYYGPNSLALGPNGSLIGTIWGDVDFFAGNVFELTESGGSWTYTQVCNFNFGPDRNPDNVVVGAGGHLYGALNGGDSGFGTLFKVR